jgi:hypothetical protein
MMPVSRDFLADESHPRNAYHNSPDSFCRSAANLHCTVRICPHPNPSAFCQDRGGGDDEWVDEAMATGVTPDF